MKKVFKLKCLLILLVTNINLIAQTTSNTIITKPLQLNVVGVGNNTVDEKILVRGNDKIIKEVPSSSFGGSSNSTVINKGFNTKIIGNGSINSPFNIDVELPSIVPSSVFIGTADSYPTNLVLDSEKNIYTSNRFSSIVSKISKTGVSSPLVNLKTYFNNNYIAVEDIAIDSFDNIYVTASNINAIVKITKAGVASILAYTNGIPLNVLVDKANYYVYSLNRGGTITRIDPNGVSTLYRTLPNECQYFCIDNLSNIYASSSVTNVNTVIKVTPYNGNTIINTLGVSPVRLISDKTNNIYVVNQASNNISKITPDGVVTISNVLGNAPLGIALDNLGNIFISNVAGNNVTKILSDNSFSVVGYTGINPNGIVVDDLGVIYTCNYTGNNVSKIVPEISGKNVIIDDKGKLQLSPLITPADLLQKQNNLLPGEGIKIEGNIISTYGAPFTFKGYKSFIALVSQSGTNSPTISGTYSNEINSIFTFTRAGVGDYTLTSSIPLTIGKHFAVMTNGYVDGIIGIQPDNNGTSFTIATKNLNGVFSDGVIYNAILEIKLYN
jgi:hypothetical protein